MRNRWFPARVADYVPFTQMKQLKTQDIDMARDFSFGVRANLEEVEEEEEDFGPKHYVRPIEINVLSVCFASLHRARVANADTTSLNGPWNF